MKKLIIALALVPLSLSASQDFVKGVDFTARSNITQSALNQIVDGAYPATNRGLVIVTNGAPSVANDPKLSRYIWLDTSINPPAVKTYNTNTVTWDNASIAAGSVGTLQLADGSVSTVKLANQAVDNSKLADDAVTSVKIVDGTIVAADLAANSVTRPKIYPSAIFWESITNGGVMGTNIASGSISSSHLALGFLVYNTNIAAGAVANSNLQANSVYGTNIATNTIAGSNIMAGAITTNNLATNIVTLLPRVFATLNTGGTILRGIGFSGCVKTSTGNFTLTFTDSPGFTNYCVIASAGDFNGAANDLGVSISTNTTTKVSVNCWNRGTGASKDPDLLYVTVLY